MKLCKDCRFYGTAIGGVHLCEHPQSWVGEISPVTGEDYRSRIPAGIQRVPGWLDALLQGRCGKGGRWWKAKVTP